jgi:putative transposase
MARHARIVRPGVPMHIVQRGHDRSECFHSDDDFQRYRSLLEESARRADCAVHAYVLMTNHVHLLVTPSKPSAPARMMQRVAGCYASRINSRLSRSGTLWEGRFWSCLIDSEHHLFACSRYVELNPVRAGMVLHPRDYPWSSYRANAECGEDSLLTPLPQYTALGRTRSECAAQYSELFATAIDIKSLDAIRRRAGSRGQSPGDSPRGTVPGRG